MSAPYETDPQVVTANGGQTTTVVIPFAGRAYINKVIVAQINGADNFTVELFNHADAMEGTERSESSSAETGEKVPLECYRVGSPMVGVAGLVRYFSEETTGGSGLLFVCKDKNPNRRGQVMRNLYLRVSPAGSGVKKFAVTIGGDAEVG